jgi:hypothetical protein
MAKVGSWGEHEELLPEVFLYPPGVGRLPGEGGAMDLEKCGEPLAVMFSEVAKDSLIGVHAEEPTDDLDGGNLSVRKSWKGTTRSASSVFDRVVHQAEDGNDEGAKIHRKRPPLASVGLGTTERR